MVFPDHTHLIFVIKQQVVQKGTLVLFVGLVLFLKCQSTAMVMLVRLVHQTTFFPGQACLSG